MANFNPVIRALAALLQTDKGKPSDKDAELAEGQRTDNNDGMMVPGLQLRRGD